jgi:hypothetical protein
MPVALVRGVRPAPGTPVITGSTVRLRVPCRGCGSLPNKAPPGPLPSYRVPDFVGHRLRVLYRWLARKTLVTDLRFGPLRAATAPRVQANYEVTAQRPAPGSKLSLGVRPGHGPPEAIKETPLRLHAGQAHSSTPGSLATSQVTLNRRR